MRVFVVVRGRVVSVRGRPFSYAACRFVRGPVVSYAGVSFSGVGGCLRTWAVLFVCGRSSSYVGGGMMVVVCRGRVGKRSLSGDVALPRWRRRSRTLTCVWAVGDGSGRWTKVLGGGRRWWAVGDVERLWRGGRRGG
jgi:hypothetical protein